MTPNSYRAFISTRFLASLLLAMIASSACTTPMPPVPPAAPPSVQTLPPVPMTQPELRPPVAAPVLAGSVIRVIDGDTLDVRLSSGPLTVRMGSIDAPEHDQPGGAEATTALARRLQGRQVELDVQAQDQYERLVAIVYLGGENMNSWLVQQGHAWAYRQYMSDPRYCVWEADARLYRRGLWAAPPGSQRAPWEWRHAQDDRGRGLVFKDYQRETAASCATAMRKGADAVVPYVPSSAAAAGAPAGSPASNGNCRIKGNISDNGKIYHVPGSEWYDRTQISTSRGERWFCTESDAQAAGWRAPR